MIRERVNATMTTFATLFSGGELAGVGVRNAGLVGAAVDGVRG